MNEFGPRVLPAVGCGELEVAPVPDAEELVLTSGVGDVIFLSFCAGPLRLHTKPSLIVEDSGLLWNEPGRGAQGTGFAPEG